MNSVKVNTPLPTAFQAQQMRASLNNNLAQAYASGDPRYSAKQYDRPGMSRGAGQWNQAGVDAAKNVADGVADAYSQDLQANALNSQMALQGRVGQEQQAQALGALNQQNAYARQMTALQRQNQLFGLLGGLLR